MKRIPPMFLAITLVTVTAFAQSGAPDGEWISYGGDKASTKYSSLDQITPENFSDLEAAWVWESPDLALREAESIRIPPGAFESTPLVVDGVLFTSTGYSQVAAIDAATGEKLWVYNPDSWKDGRPANLGFIHRGVSYWKDGDEERIIIATGNSKLITLNPKTGEPYTDFGDNGKVDLLQGLNVPARVGTHQVNSPPIICNDVIVVGNVIFDRPNLQQFVRGDVRGFDVRTGEKLWQFHSIPQAGEFGNDTWENDAWKVAGNTNVWSLMSADEDLGYVYLPFGCPTSDFYGGHRPGDNLFANSLVCLDAKTGERVWHFQTVHHDIWDYDLPAAPNLIDITVDGKDIKAVAQVGKTGWCYVFDRVTGEPVWPIEEVEVPQSTLASEKTSKTQPMPTKPPAFAQQGISEETLIDFTPELRAEALEILKNYDYGPMYFPATERGSLMLPADGGGANWSGAAWDPDNSILYVPSVNYVSVLTLVKPDPARSDLDYIVQGFTGSVKGPQGLPLNKPPYSKVTAIDLSNGTLAWQAPTGVGLEAREDLKHLNLEPTGSGGRFFPMLTKSMLIGAMGREFLVMDKNTGQTVATLPLSDSEGRQLGRAIAAPMTYMKDGKQYIVIALTGPGAERKLAAYALP